MFNLVQKRRWYFIFSAFLILPGIAVMIYSAITTGAPFRLSIDFQGGSIYDLTFEGDAIEEGQIREVFAEFGDDNVIIQQLGQQDTIWSVTNLLVEAEDPDEAQRLVDEQVSGFDDVSVQERDGGYSAAVFGDTDEAAVRDAFAELLSDESTLTEEIVTRWSIRGQDFQDPARVDELLEGLGELATIDRNSFRLETVSETIGQEVTRSAFFAVLAAIVVITGFIVIAFREVPNAFRYGVCAIFAMVHDVLVVMGVMSLLGLLLGWEIDALFLTAVLTVVGFSVQDSIVVFDRIRENIPLRLGEPYETIVNRSLWETIHRSLATQLNAFFIMIAILLFGGETVRQFIFILFIGLLSGSYSSLFTAVPLLVAWEKGEIPFINQDSELQEA